MKRHTATSGRKLRVAAGLAAAGITAAGLAACGSPLVLIMGYAGTMETWEPRFIDTLARHYRVVIFDNAGIGSTQALATPLTVDAGRGAQGARPSPGQLRARRR
jgi:pimeloyl-ACP methyl ester carboxylesterase